MKTIFVTVSIALGIALVGCSGNGGSDSFGTSPTPPASIAVPSSVVGTQGSNYGISVFAKAPGTLQPDDIVQMGSSVFVICQDTNVNPDGTLDISKWPRPQYDGPALRALAVVLAVAVWLVKRCSSALTGVGTPWRRPSRTISPFR